MADTNRPVYEQLFKTTVQKILTIIKNREIPTSQLKETDDKKVLTAEERNKINKVITDGDGTKYLANDGTYKTVSGGTGTGLTNEQNEKLNKIVTNGDGNSYLANNGNYTKINADNVINGEDNKVYTKEEQEKVGKLVTDGDGTKVLADNGTYISPNSVSVIDDINVSTTTTYSSSLIESKLTNKSDVTHTHVGLDLAHSHDNKDVLDQIDATLYGKMDKLVTDIIDPEKEGIGTKAFFDNFKFKEANAVRYIDSNAYVLLVSEGNVDPTTIYIVKPSDVGEGEDSNATFYYGTEIIGVSGTGSDSGSSILDLINEEHFKLKDIEHTLDNGDIEILKQLALIHPIKVLTSAAFEDLKANSKIDPNTLYITTTESTDDEGNKIDVLSLILTNGDGTKFLSDDGTYKEININLDDEMLDDSENPVKNNVIKAYVDALKEYVDEKQTAISEEEGNQIITKEDGIYVADVSISTEENNMLEKKDDGLYVKKVDSSISAEEGNILSKKDDGLYASVSADERNVLSAEVDGVFLGLTEDDEDNEIINAIKKQEDGTLYVEDKTKDIEKLKADVEPIKKYQRFVNTELDYFSATAVDGASAITLSANTNIFLTNFTTITTNMNTVDDAYVTLKAGERYNIEANLLTSSDAGVALHLVTDTGTILAKGYISSSSYSSTSVNIIYEPIEDTNIALQLSNNAKVWFYPSYFTIQEIGRSITIDPVEHVNTQNGLEDTPVGHIINCLGDTAPKGYLPCDGSEYNVVDYPYLAEYIKTEFGNYNEFGGDGESTFATPFITGKKLEGGTSILPIMTSNTTPEPFVASCSNSYSVSYNAWKAFNKVNSDAYDCWLANNNGTPEWIMIDCGSSYKCNSMDLAPRSYGDHATSSPKDFILQGSNDGVEFFEILSVQGQSWSSCNTIEYTFDTVSYRYYRLYITSTNGGYFCVGIFDLKFKIPMDSYYIKYEPTYYMNIYGMRTEKVLFGGEANANGTYELVDSVENYDELVIIDTTSSDRYHTHHIYINNGVLSTTIGWCAGNSTSYYAFGVISFEDNIATIKALNVKGYTYKLVKIIGIRYGSTTEGTPPSGGGNCSCPTYTDEEVNTAIDEILNSTTNEEGGTE